MSGLFCLPQQSRDDCPDADVMHPKILTSADYSSSVGHVTTVKVLT
jgi:hypothetical protein